MSGLRISSGRIMSPPIGAGFHRAFHGFLILLPALISLARTSIAQETKLKADEQILFYPGVAQRVPGATNLWRTEIRGCVFEPEKRGLMLATLREALDLKDVEMTAAEMKVFNERARLFLVDHERGKEIFVRTGGKVFPVGKSGADGRFASPVLLKDTELERRSPTRREDGRVSEHAGSETGVPFTAALRAGNRRVISGVVFPIEPEGLSVISDLDDTIKITEVRDRHATLRNTFLREFQPVAGMAEFYQALARSNGTAFHYISASPWQLYEPLAAFVRTNGFPAGTFALKPFRWKDSSFFSLFTDPEKYKPGVIEPFLVQFPKRKFILIGDSGERDPEIYAALARKFPLQVVGVYIRDVTGESASSERHQNAFREVPGSKWQIFRAPGELKIAFE